MNGEALVHMEDGAVKSFEQREYAPVLTLEQLEQKLDVIFENIPGALEVYSSLDFHGKTIEAKNTCEQEVARAQRVLEAVQGLRESIVTSLKEKVVPMQSKEALTQLGIIEQAAKLHVEAREVYADAHNLSGDKGTKMLGKVFHFPTGGHAANDA
jgi:hypothetical protein